MIRYHYKNMISTTLTAFDEIIFCKAPTLDLVITVSVVAHRIFEITA